jgi:uncharacterized membrane protein
MARSAALLAMIVFHFVTDLEMFGIIEAGTTLQGGWYVMARLIAGSFLFLVGVSLVLAHARGVRWRPFWRQVIAIAGAALVISAVTYAAMPGQFIYFGILHAIVVAKIMGLLVVTRPAWLAAPAALIVLGIWARFGLSLPLDPWLGWTGLSARPRPALDLIPVFPWLAPMFLGIVFAKLVDLRSLPPPRIPFARALAWPGQHSLAVYLLHQPILIGLLWLALQLA